MTTKRELKEILENIIRSSQGNFDHLSGQARDFARLFNKLAEDVDFLYEALGIEKDVLNDYEPTSTINVDMPEHTHPSTDLPASIKPVVAPYVEVYEEPLSIPGKKGATGPRGLQGVPGWPGEPGEDGQDGFPGTPGARGATGSQGPQGPPGWHGEDGEDGWPGVPGSRGATGAQGPAGPPGWAGEDGDSFFGTPGTRGPRGTRGATGPVGFEGPEGEAGWPGVPGARGATGDAGTQGPIGFPGDRGDDGWPGVPGARGAPGTQGPAGVPGFEGPEGELGFPGAPGSRGAPGPQGPAGPIGFEGDRGDDGWPGLPGARGATGAQGPAGVPAPFVDEPESPMFMPPGSGGGGGVTDHGALTGLSDDDHPQYATNTEFDDHSARHENGGADEISLAGLDGTPTELTNHLGDAADAHDASAISVDSTTLVGTGTDAQAVFEELDNSIADHLADAADAHAASAITNTPAGSVAATTVQAAIDELATDYAAADSSHAGAADPHTGYRLESADHTHQSTGAQAGTLDHGLALTGLADNDHPQYAFRAGADLYMVRSLY